MTRLELEPVLLVLSLTLTAAAAPGGEEQAGNEQRREAQPQGDREEAAPEVRAFLRHWAEGMQDIRALRVEFTQSKKLRILRRPLETQGCTLLKGKTVLMTVDGKDGQPETVVRVSPGEARIYYPRLKRLEVLPLGERAPPPTPFPLFGADLEALPQTYRLRLEEDEQGEVLVLTPRADDSPIRETRMRFDDQARVREVRQTTRRGDTLTLKVSKFEVNPTLADADLALEVAEGTEVVRLGPTGG